MFELKVLKIDPLYNKSGDFLYTLTIKNKINGKSFDVTGMLHKGIVCTEDLFIFTNETRWYQFSSDVDQKSYAVLELTCLLF